MSRQIRELESSTDPYVVGYQLPAFRKAVETLKENRNGLASPVPVLAVIGFGRDKFRYLSLFWLDGEQPADGFALTSHRGNLGAYRVLKWSQDQRKTQINSAAGTATVAILDPNGYQNAEQPAITLPLDQLADDLELSLLAGKTSSTKIKVYVVDR